MNSLTYLQGVSPIPVGVSLNAYGCHGSSGVGHRVSSKETNFSSVAHQSSDHTS
jgi:hypothetical protein